MFEANSLSASYHLRDLERQFRRQDLRDYRPGRSPGLVRRLSRPSTASGLAACAALFLGLGGTLWF